MVPFLYFLFFFVILALIAFVLTVRVMGRSQAASGPARVARSLRNRNRGILLFFVVLMILMPILESAIPAVSDAIETLQYAVGDVIEVEPVMVYRPSTGTTTWVNIHWLSGTISWGFYLSILVGVLAGLIAGTMAAVRRYPVLRGIGVSDVI